MGESEILTRDLFGELRTLPSGGRGRPRHQWSQQNENRVILGLAMGFSDDQLANGLGVSVPTLRKYYFSVLKRRTMQRDRFELWRMETLAEQANAGNTGAIREMGKIMERRDKARLAAALAAGGKSKDPGKKAAAKEAAKQAASEGWGGLLSPGYEH